MAGKHVENIEKIIAYINVCAKTGHSVMQHFTELGKGCAYGSDKVSYETIHR